MVSASIQGLVGYEEQYVLEMMLVLWRRFWDIDRDG